MRSYARFFALAIASGVFLCQLASAAPPVARKDNVQETFFDVETVDPYRWMEEEDSPSLGDFLAERISYARSLLDRIPGRAKLEQQLRSFDIAPSVTVRDVELVNNKFYYRAATGTDDVSRL